MLGAVDLVANNLTVVNDGAYRCAREHAPHHSLGMDKRKHFVQLDFCMRAVIVDIRRPMYVRPRDRTPGEPVLVQPPYQLIVRRRKVVAVTQWSQLSVDPKAEDQVRAIVEDQLLPFNHQQLRRFFVKLNHKVLAE